MKCFARTGSLHFPLIPPVYSGDCLWLAFDQHSLFTSRMAEEVGPTTNAADQEKDADSERVLELLASPLQVEASGLRDAGAGPVGAASADAKASFVSLWLEFASDIFGHLRTFELREKRELWRQVLERFQACDVASGVFKYVQVQPRPNSLLGSACATQARERWSPLLPHR